MIVKKKINNNESLIYLKKVNKFLVVSNQNLKLIEAYSNKSTNDFKIYLKNQKKYFSLILKLKIVITVLNIMMVK